MAKVNVDILEVLSKDGEILPNVDQEWLYDAMVEADWSDDPGTGKAVILPNPDGREVLNPTPMAPPLNYVAEESMNDRLQQMLMREKNRRDMLQALEESEEEADDFDIVDEFDISFVEPYPVREMLDEAPRLPGSGVPVAEVSKEEAARQLELDRKGVQDGPGDRPV